MIRADIQHFYQKCQLNLFQCSVVKDSIQIKINRKSFFKVLVRSVGMKLRLNSVRFSSLSIFSS